MRRIIHALTTLLVLLLCFSTVSAHSGRTDSSGGHRDNKNKSGLGSYHYHHGMSAHLHPGGICPYAPKDTISISNIPKSIDIGSSVSLEWEVTYYSSSGRVEWTSSAPEIIDVSSGVLTAKAPGKATITANLTNGSKSFTVTSKEVFPDEISISTVPERIAITSTASVSAALSPANVTNKELFWSSSNPDVLSVSGSGDITANSVGNSVITVSASGGLSRSFNVEVYEVLPERIVVQDESIRVPLGSAHMLSASVEPIDVSNKSITWTSSNPSIASVDEGGTIATHQVGTAVITATCQSVSVDIPITVDCIKADSVSFKDDSYPSALNIGDEFYPTVLFEPENTTYQDVTFTSSDPTVVEVAGNRLLAVGYGSTTITAIAKDGYVSTDIRISNPDDGKAIIGFFFFIGVTLVFAVAKKGYDNRKWFMEHPQYDRSKWMYKKK